MAIRPESRWWIVTLVLVGVLFGLSALALDRPNVHWSQGVAHCPLCGTPVRPGTRRCRECREEYDWTVAPDEDAPLSPWTLAPLEAQAFAQRVKALGPEAARARVAQALGVTPDAARAWLEAMEAGQCGWCGGTGEEPQLATPGTAGTDDACRVCRGRKRCITCGRGAKMRQGDAAAGVALERLRLVELEFRPSVPLEAQRAELARLNEAFLERFAGTVEAVSLVDPATWQGPKASPAPATLAAQARSRIERVLEALSAP
jgi:hypothetical protein